MDCAQFEEFLHDLDRPGTGGFALRDIALVHVETCSHCAQLLTQAEWLDLVLHAVSTTEIAQQAAPRVEAALMNEFRRRRAATSGPRVRWQLATLGAAAAVLLVLGFSLRHRIGPASGSVQHSQDASLLSGEGKPGNASNPVSPSVAPDSSGQEETVAENELGDSGDATAFVALPYADDSAAHDGGAIIRVVLSRPALASLGLPVTDLGATDRIPADIVVSEDGAPQAIRLVSQSSLDQ